MGKSLPFDPQRPDWSPGPHKGHGLNALSFRADNPIGALQGLEPFTEPDPSIEERSALRDAVCNALDGLSPELRDIFDAIASERLSIREASQRFGIPRSSLHRKYKKACKELTAALSYNPEVELYLKGQYGS